MEPRISGIKADDFIKKSGFACSNRVEAEGFSGGIWLLWRSFIEVEVSINHSQCIHFKFCKNKVFMSWVTAVYASPNPMLRRQLWDRMENIASSIQGPWLIGGDFNSILYASEKQGGVGRNSGVCNLFRKWYDGHQIFDLNFKGPRFTWSRGLLFKRLDRALYNNEWLLKYTENSVLHLPKVASDHRPVLVRFARDRAGHKRNRPFRFLAAWLTHDQFNNFVKRVWNPQTNYSIAASHFVQEVQAWNCDVFGNIFQRKRRLLAWINGIQATLEKYSSRSLMHLEARLRNELETVMSQEEILWLQKSRKDWLLHGDRNTNFFHQKTITRRRRNRIEAIRESSGNWLYDE
ncbi:uncharacterized protein LOC112099735 [Citrus clementina]|uniref:uncharacterized protein LOC112099735 n=1 Tax=Citrus clementina TaxID=85681 RepID=UPI000CED5095|nr:uncharacterized protein LOC112099735 [Citrus x clementina]